MTEVTGWFGAQPNRMQTDVATNISIPAEREAFLDDAIRAGKLTEKRRAHYAALYDKDPVGTRKLVASLASAHESDGLEEAAAAANAYLARASAG